jgi:hypothetical protein
MGVDGLDSQRRNRPRSVLQGSRKDGLSDLVRMGTSQLWSEGGR